MQKREKRSIIIAVVLFLFFTVMIILGNPNFIGYTIFRGLSITDSCLNNTLDNSSVFNSQAVIYFKFNNRSIYGENDQVVCDLSGHGHTGFITGAQWKFNWGPYGDGSFYFNGDDDITTLDNDAFSPNTTGAMTVSFWLKPSTFNFAGGNDVDEHNAVHFLGKYSTDSNREWYFRIYNASATDGDNRNKRISFYMFNLNGGLGAGSYFQDDLNEAEWIHIVGMVDGVNTFIYKNGVLRDSDPLSGYDIHMEKGNADLTIGRYNPDYLSLIGSIDELRIFNRTLSSSEIQQLYSLVPGSDNITSENSTNSTNSSNGLEVVINSPVSTTYSVNDYLINISLSEEGYCLYSLDNGQTNSTLINSVNIAFTRTKSNVANGNYSLFAYCNDTEGDVNNSVSVNFVINEVIVNSTNSSNGLEVVINSPVSTTYSVNDFVIDIDLNEAGYCVYTLDNGLTNESLSNSSNTFTATKTNAANGDYSLFAYCNDTEGDVNNSVSVNFVINEVIVNSTNSSSVGESTNSSSESDGGGGGVVNEETSDSSDVVGTDSGTTTENSSGVENETESNNLGSTITGRGVTELEGGSKKVLQSVLAIGFLTVLVSMAIVVIFWKFPYKAYTFIDNIVYRIRYGQKIR